ncbi:CPBP family glutamic-type intramembrane protease [Croceiramulus getboli]|nr:CPBP family intramembrane metalloprotease [Flavobacteriaceae bacterium YJPT1-3]
MWNNFPQTPKLRVNRLLLTFILLFGAYLLFFIGLGLLKTHYPELGLEEYEQSRVLKMIKEEPLRFLILAIIIAPLVEEMLFRTLLHPSHNDLLWCMTSWPVFLMVRFLPLDVHWLVKAVFTLIFLFSVFYLLREGLSPARTQKIRIFLRRHTTLILLLTSFIFGLVHINNYVSDFIFNLSLFVLIIPRILAGLALGFIKIANRGLGWSILLHAMNNGVVFLISMLLYRVAAN